MSLYLWKNALLKLVKNSLCQNLYLIVFVKDIILKNRLRLL